VSTAARTVNEFWRNAVDETLDFICLTRAWRKESFFSALAKMGRYISEGIGFVNMSKKKRKMITRASLICPGMSDLSFSRLR
jgi:hypothetical protein